MTFVLSELVQQLITLTPLGLAVDAILGLTGMTIGKLHRQHIEHKNHKRD